MALLEIIDLEVSFGKHKALHGINLSLDAQTRLGIVGESGAGKSMVAFAILNLIQQPGLITAGKVIFDGQDLTKLSPQEIRKIRGKRIAMIFQDPMMTLNPVLTIGLQMVETLMAHQSISYENAKAIAIEKLKLVAIPSPEERFDSYPHELSGGLRQRVVIAIALLCEPELIIADEPTTALDVTIQAGIMALLLRLCEEKGMALMLITHDLALVAETCKELAVMYAGRVIEYGSAAKIIHQPMHPYSEGLLNALPQMNHDHLDNNQGKIQRGKLNQIRGNMPGIYALPSGCSFHPRCDLADENCKHNRPHLRQVTIGNNDMRYLACHQRPEHSNAHDHNIDQNKG